MCRTCYFRTKQRLVDAIKRAEAECESRPVPVVRDLTDVARKALSLSLKSKRAEKEIERAEAGWNTVVGDFDSKSGRLCH
jgi:hypothetical protein